MHQTRKVVSQKSWKDSASLIIAAPANTKKNSSVDFNLLYLKRGAKSSFFPNAYVYPGGVFDEADRSKKWIDLFKKVDSNFCENVRSDFFIQQNDRKRSPLFSGDEDSLKRGILPNEIAFRICAIRESFEESGLLLLTSDVESRKTSGESVHAESLTPLLSRADVEKWRTKVHNDAYEFVNLCTELEKVPDIWSLKEWFEWLTPIFTNKRMPKRYDTVFYICCLKEAPSYYAHDEVETSDSVWLSPEDMIQRCLSRKALLAPPQIVETLKLMSFKSFHQLSTHINERALKGMRRTLPFILKLKDSMIETYPGDDLYPKDEEGLEMRFPDFTPIDLTLADYLASSANKFSMVFRGDVMKTTPLFQCNIKLDYDQVSPAKLENVGAPVISKL